MKGRGSHDGFHRWSVEIAGKDFGSLRQQRAGESEREIWVEGEGLGGGKERERDGGREGVGGACLRKVTGENYGDWVKDESAAA